MERANWKDPLSQKAMERLRDALEPDERIVWTGRPRPQRVAAELVPQALLAVVFIGVSIGVLLDFASLAVGNVHGGRATNQTGSNGLSVAILAMFSAIWAVPGVFGFGVLLSPAWAWRNARNTVYLLTDRRAISAYLSSHRVTLIHWVPFAEMKSVIAAESHGGVGSLSLDSNSLFSRPLSGRGLVLLSPSWHMQGFVGIANVWQVEALVRRAIEKGRLEEADAFLLIAPVPSVAHQSAKSTPPLAPQ